MYDRIIINSQPDLRKHLRDEYVLEKVIIMCAVTIYVKYTDHKIYNYICVKSFSTVKPLSPDSPNIPTLQSLQIVCHLYR